MQDERKTKGELITEVRELRQRLITFEQEQQELKQSLIKRERAENIMQARLRLLKFAESHSLEEFTQATLDELEALTTSKIGFYHLVEADQRTLSLQTWSTNTLQHMCTAEGKGQHYDIAEAGVWVDCIHQRRSVIHNNYDALPHRKGMPLGHAPVVRELVVPIFRDSKIVAIIGMGNKPSDYDEWDVEMVSLLGDLSWDITERKRAEEELHRYREELEQRVIVRTADLRHAVEQLQWEVTERQQAEEAIRESEERLRFLASQLLTAQETERNRLSRELHDDLGQTLLVLRMQLSGILRRCSLEPEPRLSLEEAATYLLGVIDKVRRLSHDLSPSTLEGLGLAEALRNLFEEFQGHHGNAVIIKADIDEVEDSLPRETNIAIYRIAQEFLVNVHKHAEASQVTVAIKALPEKVTVSMEDNGKGFNLEEIKDRPKDRRGLGVASIEERLRMLGSQFSMTSHPGKGTRLYFEIFRAPEQRLPRVLGL
jgi:signal transduction histidine kinase